jgi:polyisoprenoid-binding protein YceI
MTETSSTAVLANVVGTWQLDPKATTIEFHTKAMWGLAKVKGTFSAVRGSGQVGDQGAVSGELVMDAKSVDTHNKKRDQHLRSADFFDVEHHPTFGFDATAVTAGPDGAATIKGSLRLKDQTHPIELTATSSQSTPDRLTVSAETTIDRSQWGVTWKKMGAGLINRVIVVAEFTRSTPTT